MTDSGKPRPRRDRGTTVLELVIALVIFGVLLTVAIGGWHRLADQRAVAGAGTTLRSAFATARRAAVARTTPVAVRLDAVAGRAVIHAGSDTILVHPLAAAFGVRLLATRDSMAYDAAGLGAGAANLSAVLTRGAAAETVIVARLGRVR